MKSAVDKALAEGKTLAEILAGVTTDPTLKTEQVEKITALTVMTCLAAVCLLLRRLRGIIRYGDCFRYECQWKNNG